jgi:hypothetical protein
MYAEHDMDLALTEYADHLRADYIRWSGADEAWRYDIEFQRGKKFIRVVKVFSGTCRGAHSFVCIQAHDGWHVGDILKAASWSAPAKNFPRGNVLDRTWAATRWTGA